MTPSKHEKELRALRCIISGTDQQIELHHAHSGSMGDAGWHRGGSRKSNPFLQIPITHRYHTGEFNPEAMGMRTWEAMFGTQMEMLEDVSDLLGYDVFEEARRYEN